MRTITSDFSYRGQHYSIVFNDKFYMTINHKFIGDDGRLTKDLNFTDGLHTASSMDECIKLTMDDLDIKFYEAQGMSKAEAFSMVMNVPKEIAEMIYEAAVNC